MGHWMSKEEKAEFGIDTPLVKVHSGWETLYYYLDDNGVAWAVDAYRRQDGWTEWRSRPSAVATSAEKATKLYRVGASRFPVASLTSTSEDDKDDGVQTRGYLAASIDDFVASRKGKGWLIALLLLLAAMGKRRG